MPNYCPHCGEDLHDADNFCPHCGDRLPGSSWEEKKEKIRGFLGDRAADLFAKDVEDEFVIDWRSVAILAAVVLAAVTLLVVLVWPDSGGTDASVEPLQVQDVQIEGLDLQAEDGVVGVAELRLHNPNEEDGVIEQITYELYIDGNRAGEGGTGGQYIIPNSSTGNISVSLDIHAVPSLGGIGSYAWNQLVNQSNQTLVNGRLDAEFGSETLSSPFSRTIPS